MSKIEITVAVDATNGEQLLALSNYLTALAALQGTAPTKVQTAMDRQVAETVAKGLDAAEGKAATETPAPTKPAAKRSTKAKEVVKETEEESPAAAAAKEEAPEDVATAKAESSVDIATLRTLLSQKVDDHRDSIKDKLTEFGAKNITSLDSDKYQEMYDFLTALK